MQVITICRAYAYTLRDLYASMVTRFLNRHCTCSFLRSCVWYLRLMYLYLFTGKVLRIGVNTTYTRRT
jgi:hypothetical protein